VNFYQLNFLTRLNILYLLESMLGIIFTGGESPSPDIIRSALNGKSAFFVAADSGLITAENAGIKPDYVIGDMDSVNAERLDSYPADRVIRHKHDKDYTDTELALSHALEKGCEEVWIIGGGGGRIDHLLAIRSLFEREVFPRRWITNASDIYCIEAQAAANKLSAGLEKGASVSIFPLGTGPWEAESEGLKWPLEGLAWDRGFYGLSNVAENGDFSIMARKGRFMVILPLAL
jgi:thiamine pyrophosphokinase